MGKRTQEQIAADYEAKAAKIRKRQALSAANKSSSDVRAVVRAISAVKAAAPLADMREAGTLHDAANVLVGIRDRLVAEASKA